MELQIIIASILRRYSFILERPDQVVSVSACPGSIVPDLLRLARDTRGVLEEAARLQTWH
jgi:hypothetical protein